MKYKIENYVIDAKSPVQAAKAVKTVKDAKTKDATPVKVISKPYKNSMYVVLEVESNNHTYYIVVANHNYHGETTYTGGGIVEYSLAQAKKTADDFVKMEGKSYKEWMAGDSVKDSDYSYDVIKSQIYNENFEKRLLLSKAYNGYTRGDMTKQEYEKLVEEIKKVKDSVKDTKTKDAKVKDSSASGMYRGVYYSYNFVKNKIDLYVNEELKKSFNLDSIKDIREVYEYIDKNYASLIKDSKIKDYYDVKPGAIFKSGRRFHSNEVYIKVMNVKEGVVVYNEIIKQPNGQYTAHHPYDAELSYFKHILSEREFRPVTSLYDSDIEHLSEDEVEAVEAYKQAIKNTSNLKLIELYKHILEEEEEHLRELENASTEDSCTKDYQPPYAIWVKDEGKWKIWGGSNSANVDKQAFLKKGYEDVKVVENGQTVHDDEKSQLEAELKSLEAQWDRADDHNDEWTKTKIDKQIEEVQKKLNALK